MAKQNTFLVFTHVLSKQLLSPYTPCGTYPTAFKHLKGIDNKCRRYKITQVSEGKNKQNIIGLYSLHFQPYIIL